ncbi:hypothetical protein NCC49_005915 [Naganishia albida]|nr:hypothetical protein NCC49_005915 [Naganishia albida]
MRVGVCTIRDHPAGASWVKIANFGAAKRAYSGVSGGVVLDWRVLDTEVKTANLKNSSLAGPDLLVSGNFRHNWRTGYSYRKPDTFLPYADNVADYSFPYTAETWNNPQALWTFAASEVFNTHVSDGA